MLLHHQIVNTLFLTYVKIEKLLIFAKNLTLTYFYFMV